MEFGVCLEVVCGCVVGEFGCCGWFGFRVTELKIWVRNIYFCVSVRLYFPF